MNIFRAIWTTLFPSGAGPLPQPILHLRRPRRYRTEPDWEREIGIASCIPVIRSGRMTEADLRRSFGDDIFTAARYQLDTHPECYLAARATPGKPSAFQCPRPVRTREEKIANIIAGRHHGITDDVLREIYGEDMFNEAATRPPLMEEDGGVLTALYHR